MASNALVRLRNTGVRDLAFEIDISNPVKLVSQLILPPNRPVEVEVETVVAMTLFDTSFQNAVASGLVTIAFAFTTSNGVASTSGNYLANIRRCLNANGSGWVAS